MKKYIVCLLVVVVLTIITVLSIVLLNNRIPSDVAKINDEIADLENIDNDETKMLKIMQIEKEVQTISVDKQAKINMSKLSYETTHTVSKLKNSLEWSECLSVSDSYLRLNSISEYFDHIEKIEMMAGRYSSVKVRINDSSFIEGLFGLFELPYVDIEERDSFWDEYEKLLIGDQRMNYHFICKTSNENITILIDVYESGYVVIGVNERIGDDVYDVVGRKLAISLIPLDTAEFWNYISYDNLKKYVCQ